MAGYNSNRRNGVNVSQYIANLNKEPSAFEVARSEEQNFTVDDESLAQFTNAEFFEFDAADFLHESNTAVGALGFDDDAKKQPSERVKDGNGMDFVTGTFPIQCVSPFEVNTALTQQGQQPQPIFPDYASHHVHHPGYHQTTSPTTSPAYPNFPSTTTPSGAGTGASAASPADSSSDPARALAEEDKRRRNTAASARFRVKKKQREQALEQETQELKKAKQVLEQRVGQLETENEWLRGLVVEKNSGGGGGKDRRIVEKETDKETETETGKKKGVGTEA